MRLLVKIESFYYVSISCLLACILVAFGCGSAASL